MMTMKLAEDRKLLMQELDRKQERAEKKLELAIANQIRLEVGELLGLSD